MKLEFLVIHCTATPAGMKVTPEDIRKWHLSPPPAGRGWSQVGYSEMILLDGSFVTLVPYNEDDKVDKWEITNGVAGINSRARHIVYVGGTDKDLKPLDTRGQEQLKTMTNYVLKTVKKYPDIKVAGHNQFAAKACPSFDVPQWAFSIGVPAKNIYRPLNTRI